MGRRIFFLPGIGLYIDSFVAPLSFVFSPLSFCPYRGYGGCTAVSCGRKRQVYIRGGVSAFTGRVPTTWEGRHCFAIQKQTVRQCEGGFTSPTASTDDKPFAEGDRYSVSVNHPPTPPLSHPPLLFCGHVPLLHKAGESKDCVHLVSSHANDVGLTALHLDPLPSGPARADVAETFYLVDLADSALATEIKGAGKSVVYQVTAYQH